MVRSSNGSAPSAISTATPSAQRKRAGIRHARTKFSQQIVNERFFLSKSALRLDWLRANQFCNFLEKISSCA
jgi:hypothetical protein